jgi:quinol monooxygenase YgiN
MIQLTVRIKAGPGRAHDLVDALHMLKRCALQTRGCVRACCAADVDEAELFWYCEDWESEDALEAKVRSEQFAHLLALMETSVRPPSLEFRVIGESRGLEYAATVRSGRPAGDSRP